MPDLSTYEGRQQARDEAAAQGRSVVVDAGGVYDRSTGETTTYAPSGGGAGGGGGAAANPLAAGVDLGAITRGFAASAGMSQKQLDEQIRQFDQTLEWQKKMWEQQGLPQLAIQQRAADLEESKFKELTAQAHQQQAFVEEIGRRQAALAEKSQADANTIAQGQLGLGQSQLGLQTLQAAAGLSGPADWIKAANFTRGVQGTNLPGFIQQLLSGQSTANLAGPAAGAQMSNPVTLGSLAQRMGVGAPSAPGAPAGAAGAAGGTAAGAPAAGRDWIADINAPSAQQPTATGDPYAAAANNLRQVYQAGGAALGPQQLEGLTKPELDMFTGGGADVGADVPGFLDAYKRSRIGQSSGAFAGAY